MSERLDELDDHAPDRWRYATVRSGASFPKSMTIEVSEMQERLEALFAATFRYEEGSDTLATHLAQEVEALDQGILGYVPTDEL